MPRRPTHRAIAPVAVAVVVGLSAAACGDDAEPASSSPTTAGSPSSASSTDSTVSSAAPSSTTAATKTTTAAGTIVDVAAGAGSFTVLVEAVKAAGLLETLAGPGPFTVLAPTDAAFGAALAQLGTTKEQLLADKATLSTILRYHVIPGEAKASDVVALDGKEVASVAGPALRVSVSGSEVRVNDAKVTKTDVDASNGVIHVIDKVLLPPA